MVTQTVVCSRPLLHLTPAIVSLKTNDNSRTHTSHSAAAGAEGGNETKRQKQPIGTSLVNKRLTRMSYIWLALFCCQYQSAPYSKTSKAQSRSRLAAGQLFFTDIVNSEDVFAEE